MADTGLLDPTALEQILGPDTLKQLQAYMQLMQPQQSTKDQANRNAMIDFGLGLMGARKGSEWATIGNSGLNAMQNRNKDIAAQQAQTGQNVSQAMQLMGMARQNQTLAQQQMALKAFNAALGGNGGAPATTQGPPAGFQIPGGATALTNAAVSDTTPAANSLPTQVPAQAGTVDQRNQLANAALLLHLAGGPDMSGALKFKYPDDTVFRPNAFGKNSATGQLTHYPIASPGHTIVQNADGSFAEVPLKGGAEAVATSAAIPALVNKYTSEQTGIMPGGGKGILGTQGESLFGPGGVLGALSGVVGGQSQRSPVQPQGVPHAQTELSPEEHTKSSGYGEYYNSVIAAGDNAAAQKGNIAQLTEYAKQIPFGRYAPMQLNVGSAVLPFSSKAAGVLTGIENPESTIPAMQAYNKLAFGLVAKQTRDLGPREAVQAMQMVASANPNVALTAGGNEAILHTLRGTQQYALDKQAAIQKWVADPANHGSIDGFAQSFNQTNPYEKYVPPLSAIELATQGKDPGDYSKTAKGGAEPSYAIAPAARSSPMAPIVQQALKNGTPEQRAKLAAKGYLVTQ